MVESFRTANVGRELLSSPLQERRSNQSIVCMHCVPLELDEVKSVVGKHVR